MFEWKNEETEVNFDGNLNYFKSLCTFNVFGRFTLYKMLDFYVM